MNFGCRARIDSKPIDERKSQNNSFIDSQIEMRVSICFYLFYFRKC